jgi:hypothetical protein
MVADKHEEKCLACISLTEMFKISENLLIKNGFNNPQINFLDTFPKKSLLDLRFSQVWL